MKSNNERRSTQRVRVSIPARWEGVLSNSPATVTDLSRSGCFVLTGGKVEVKELIFLEMEMPDRHIVQVWAEVVEEANEIGFALRFNFASEEDEKHLGDYIDELLKSESVKS